MAASSPCTGRDTPAGRPAPAHGCDPEVAVVAGDWRLAAYNMLKTCPRREAEKHRRLGMRVMRIPCRARNRRQKSSNLVFAAIGVIVSSIGLKCSTSVPSSQWVRLAVQADRSAFQNCARMFSPDGSRSGELTLEWTTGDRGEVKRTRTLGGDVPALVAACIEERIALLRFDGVSNETFVHTFRVPSDFDLQNQEFADILRGRQEDFDACLKKQRNVGRPLEGHIVVQWFISPDGETRKVLVVENSMGEELSNCVQRVAEACRFPTGFLYRDRIRYTFRFNTTSN